MQHPGEDNAPSEFQTAFIESLKLNPLVDATPRNQNDVRLIKYMTHMITVIMEHVNKIEDMEVRCWYDQRALRERQEAFEEEKKSMLDSIRMDSDITREIVKHVADAVCICEGPGIVEKN